uniref:DYNc domain-containing protein n=1 Tax=Macrostomum lignano TaxID=282301 RepID=A0A1I8F431_9PLAT
RLADTAVRVVAQERGLLLPLLLAERRVPDLAPADDTSAAAASRGSHIGRCQLISGGVVAALPFAALIDSLQRLRAQPSDLWTSVNQFASTRSPPRRQPARTDDKRRATRRRAPLARCNQFLAQHKSSDGPTPAKQVKSPDASKPFTPALSQQYRERIRPVLNSIDRLRSHGLQNELRLPTVAVVGDQSVLEAISGVDLPRGSGIVTRCPLQLSMRSKPTGDWTGRIRASRSSAAYRKHRADVSDLTLVDLPGIARYSEKNPKINEVTKQLILSYISQEQVIILVVVPCSVDIETVEAIASKPNRWTQGAPDDRSPESDCPDLTNPGSEEDIKAIVNNQGRVRLHKGFVMVKCRSSPQGAQEQHHQLPKDIVGTKTLAEKLTNELFKAVAAGIETLEESL